MNIFEYDNYNLHVVESNKFKTFLLEVNFFNKYEKTKTSSREAMLRMLFMSNKKYKTSIDIAKRCEELYDPLLYFEQDLMGDFVVVSLYAKFIDPKYVKEENYFEDLVSYFFNLINNPLFNEENLSFVKKEMINDIYSIQDNPSNYAQYEFFKLLDSSDARGESLIGNIDSISKLTLKDIEDEYKRFISDSFIEISLGGRKINKEYIEIINKYSEFKNNKKLKDFNPYKDTLVKTKEFEEEKEYSQSTLLMLFNLDNLTNYEKNITFILFNEILGGYSVNSVLNTNLREKNSICYGVNSSYHKYFNSLIIKTSISLDNIDIAKKLIFESLNDMKNISLSDLENAKKRYKLYLKSNENNLFSLNADKLYSDLGLIYDSSKKLEEFERISLDDIKALSDKISYNSSFVLKGVENGKD